MQELNIDDYIVLDYDETNNRECEDENCKKYISELRTFNINNEVKIWVENKLLNIERRKHKIDNKTLASYIVIGYRDLNKDFDLDEILTETKTVKYKKKILDLISGESTENNPINELNIGIPIIIKSPLEFINIVLRKFNDVKNIIDEDHFDKILKNIEKFSFIMYSSIPLLKNYEPRSLACSMVFFYLNDVLNVNIKSKISVKKTHFINLIFNVNKKTDVNPKDFNACYIIIKESYYNFITTCKSKKCIKGLIKY